MFRVVQKEQIHQDLSLRRINAEGILLNTNQCESIDIFLYYVSFIGVSPRDNFQR